jgi:gas vesicle protein
LFRKEQSVKTNTNITINGSTINGNITTADSITKSFNQAQNSTNASSELKELLNQFQNAIKSIAEKLPPDSAEQLANDVETFTKEVTSPKPRKKFWELSLEGIKDASNAVGVVGTQAFDLAAKIAQLLS